jgi:hypothetical protein
MLMTMTTRKAFVERPQITSTEKAQGKHVPLLLRQADAATTIMAVEEDRVMAAARERNRTLRLPFVLNAAFWVLSEAFRWIYHVQMCTRMLRQRRSSATWALDRSSMS